jgi:hypothetical protein
MNRKHVGLAALTALTLVGILAAVPSDALARGGHGGRGRGPVVIGGFSAMGPYFGGFYPYYGFGSYGFNPYFDGYFGPYHSGPEGGIDANVAAMAGLGAIDLNVKPNRAEVWVDGTYYGEARNLDGTPSYLWLPEGTHQLSIRKGGYAGFEASVAVHRGIAKELKLRLHEKAEESASSGSAGAI